MLRMNFSCKMEQILCASPPFLRNYTNGENMLKVNVSTLIFGKGEIEHPLPDVSLRLVSQRTPAHEIITQTVKEQLNTLVKDKIDYPNIRNRIANQYLKKTDIEQQSVSGKIALQTETKERKTPSLEHEVERVLKAFKNNSFKMFVDGDEISNPNELCTVLEGSKIKFVRLIPLVGG